MSGFFSPAAAKMSITSSEATARETICRMAWSSSSGLRRSSLSALGQDRPAPPGRSRRRRGCASASSWGTARAKALDSSVTALSSRFLPSSCARTCSWAAGSSDRRCLWVAGRPGGPVEAVEDAAGRSRTSPASRPRPRPGRWPSAPGRRSRCRSASACLQLVGQAEIVHHQAAGLVLEHPVDPGDGLHQPVAAHRLVHVHGVQAGRVEAGQPHVAHDDHLERVLRVLEPLGQFLAARLVADVRLPLRAGRRPSRSSRS